MHVGFDPEKMLNSSPLRMAAFLTWLTVVITALPALAEQSDGPVGLHTLDPQVFFALALSGAIGGMLYGIRVHKGFVWPHKCSNSVLDLGFITDVFQGAAGGLVNITSCSC